MFFSLFYEMASADDEMASVNDETPRDYPDTYSEQPSLPLLLFPKSGMEAGMGMQQSFQD